MTTRSADPGPALVDTGARRDRPPTWWVVATSASVLVLVVVIVVAIVLVRQPAPVYSTVTERRFIDACSADGGDPVRPACQCLYDEITRVIPYDRFNEIDGKLVAASRAGDPFVLPDDIAVLVPNCRVLA